MKVLEAFQIPIIALEDKTYAYTFAGDDSFFAAFEQDWVEKGKFDVKVDLTKSALMIQVQMQIVIFGVLNLNLALFLLLINQF